MSAINTAHMREVGQRFDYLADIAVLQAAGIDYTGYLEGDDVPMPYDGEALSASSEAIATFWDSYAHKDPTVVAVYDRAINQRLDMAKTVGRLIGSVNGYQLSHFTEGQITLSKPTNPDMLTGSETVLEMDFFGPEGALVTAKAREILEGRGRSGLVLSCALEVTPDDMDAIALTVSRIGDVIMRMRPGDMTVSELSLRGEA